jgi:hypothetical protein
MAGCHPCQNGSAKYPQTCWRCKGAGASPTDRRTQRTPELIPPLPSTPPAPTGNTSVAKWSQIINLPVGYTYSNTALPCAESFKDDEDTQRDTDLDRDTLTDEGTYTGLDTICLCGNAGNIHFKDQRSALSDPATDDKH